MLNLDYIFSKVDIFLRFEYRAKQFNIQGRSSDIQSLKNQWDTQYKELGKYFKPYFLLHLGANYNITPKIRLNFAIYNALNHNFVDYNSAGIKKGKESWYNSYAYIHEGRRYFINLNIDF